MSLSDNIRKAASDKSTENAPKGDATAELQKQMSVSATGKAVAAGQTQKQSNIAEQLGMISARNAQDTVQQQGHEQAQKIAQSEAEQQTKEKEVQNANQIKEIEFKAAQLDRFDAMMAEVEYSNAALEDREDALHLEMMGQALRLSDEKYRHEITQIGERDRIDVGANMKREINRLEIGEKTALLYKSINDEDRLKKRKRKDREEEIIMGLNDALKVAEAKLEDQVSAAKMDVLTGSASSGFDAYGGTDQLKKDWEAYDSSDGAAPTQTTSRGSLHGEDTSEVTERVFDDPEYNWNEETEEDKTSRVVEGAFAESREDPNEYPDEWWKK